MSNTMQLKAQIKNIASKNHMPAQAVLQNFMQECLLERISISKYKDMFILKGGMLISSLVGINSRTTMDMDTTLSGYPLTEESIRKAISEICSILLKDEVIFFFGSIEPIHEEEEYGGFRVAILAEFGSIRTPLKIDITTGDVITPRAIRYSFRSNFEDKKIKIWAYNLETILAEKVETILRRSVLNTCPRDFYDVYIITKTKQKTIDEQMFLAALEATSQKRMSQHAIEEKEKIIRNIQADPLMKIRWERYCRDNYYAKGIGFDELMKAIEDIFPQAA
jgi:predicted nucleotidyltransferase component of viral defense system